MKANKIKCLAATFLLAVISSNQVKSFCQATTDTTSSTVMNEKKETNPNDGDLGSKLEELGYVPIAKGIIFDKELPGEIRYKKASNGKNLWVSVGGRTPNLRPAFRAYKQYVAGMEKLEKVLPDYVEMLSNKQVAKQLKKLSAYRPDITEKFTKEQFVSWYKSANSFVRGRFMFKYLHASQRVLESKNIFLKTKLSPDFTEQLFSYSDLFGVVARECIRCSGIYDFQLDSLISIARKRQKSFPSYFETCGLLPWGAASRDFYHRRGNSYYGELDTLLFKKGLTAFFESKRESGIFIEEPSEAYTYSTLYIDDKTIWYCDDSEYNELRFNRLKDGRWLVSDWYFSPDLLLSAKTF